jgi:hypothetical protein
MNRIPIIALAALFVCAPCAAQSPSELLQKGIYLQETEGDQDAAIRIYRQITSSAGQSPAAVQAQYLIAQAMLRKGDLNAAAVEFSTLSANYPEGKAIIARLASYGGVPGAGAQLPVRSHAIHDGRYHDASTGLEFAVPAQWTVRYDGPSSDGGNMVGLAAPGSNVDYGIWMKPNEWSAAEIPSRLRRAVDEKAKANSFHQGFAFRPESIQPRTVAGQPALSAIADYVENGRRMINYYVWVYTPKTHSVFLARDVAAEDLPTVQANLESLVATAQVP